MSREPTSTAGLDEEPERQRGRPAAAAAAAGGKAVFAAQRLRRAATRSPTAGATGTVGPDLDKLPECAAGGQAARAVHPRVDRGPERLRRAGLPAERHAARLRRALLEARELDALVQYLASVEGLGSDGGDGVHEHGHAAQHAPPPPPRGIRRLLAPGWLRASGRSRSSSGSAPGSSRSSAGSRAGTRSGLATVVADDLRSSRSRSASSPASAASTTGCATRSASRRSPRTTRATAPTQLAGLLPGQHRPQGDRRSSTSSRRSSSSSSAGCWR